LGTNTQKHTLAQRERPSHTKRKADGKIRARRGSTREGSSSRKTARSLGETVSRILAEKNQKSKKGLSDGSWCDCQDAIAVRGGKAQGEDRKSRTREGEVCVIKGGKTLYSFRATGIVGVDKASRYSHRSLQSN